MNAPSPAGRPGPGNDPRDNHHGLDDQSPVETVKLSHPRDIVAAVPYLLGFHPEPASIVVLALHAGRIALTMRVAAPDPTDAPLIWRRLAKPLAEAATDDVAVVGYLPAEQEPLLLEFADASPIPPVDVLRVHDGRWWSLTCPNGPDCCPPGEPVTADPAVTAPLIARAGAPAASRADLASCLRPGPAVMLDAVAVLLPLDPLPPAQALFGALVDAHADRVDGPLSLGPGSAALLLQALADVRIRDVCCGWHDDAAWWLWTDLIRVTPSAHVPAVATLMATTAYQRGDVVLARLATEHALAADSGYGLARLMHAAINAHLHPAVIRETLAVALAEIATLPGYAHLQLPQPGGPTSDRDGTDPHQG
jgi:Domain of unknown function (DUF4192)